MSFSSSFSSNTWIRQAGLRHLRCFCKTAHRKETVYLQGKQCHLWSQTANCLETPRMQHPQHHESHSVLSSDTSVTLAGLGKHWNADISGKLLLHTRLIQIQHSKGSLKWRNRLSVFSEPYKVYNVLRNPALLLTLLILTSDFCSCPPFVALTKHESQLWELYLLYCGQSSQHIHYCT